MYRTSSHEPRYKHSTRKGHADSREASENSTSEEESTCDSRTEESDDTLASRGCESYRKGSALSAESSSFHHRRPYSRYNPSESCTATNVCHSRVIKHDKITQKNLLSPLPSFTIPPIYRELGVPGQYKPTQVKSTRERQTETRTCGRPPRRKDSCEGDDSVCYIHRTPDRTDRRQFDRHRTQGENSYHRGHRSERVLTCVNTSQAGASPAKIQQEPAGKFPTEPTAKHTSEVPAKDTPKQHPTGTVTTRRPKTADQDSMTSSKLLENRGRSRRKSATGTCPDVQGEALLSKGKKGRKLVGDGPGEVKEKLVYVVEEKGKDVTKLETDLFTLNEILAIKKDLLELSEFAKKLKKLKEMKKESESGTHQPNPCTCKPAADLLKDVNMRIEALEARQEELERGIAQKGDIETESKKTTNFNKPSLDSQSKTPLATKISALPPISSFPKMEVFMQRGDDMSNNSDIVNELMDIKTQLFKLEQKRTSKVTSEDAIPESDKKFPKKDEHAIAVYSSRTYILTDNFEKRKQDVKVIEEEKLNNYCSTREGESRKDLTKENVTNWLKGVSPKTTEVSQLPPTGFKKEESLPWSIDRKVDLKCKNCSQILKVDENQNQVNCSYCFLCLQTGSPGVLAYSARKQPRRKVTTAEGGTKIALHTTVCPTMRNSLRLNNIQEPQKNRATEKDGRGESDVGLREMSKVESAKRQQIQPKKYKECIVTPSGKLFACVNSSMLSGNIPEQNRPQSACLPVPQEQQLVVVRTESSCSIPSGIAAKERVQKISKETQKHNKSAAKVIKSRSMQELSAFPLFTKMDKPDGRIQKEKKHKDGKNQYLKLLEAHLMALKKTLKKGSNSVASSSYSEFLASVNLEVPSTSQATELQGSGDNKATVMAYSAAATMDDLIPVDNCPDKRMVKRMVKEKEMSRKRKEQECKKLLKKRMKEYKRCENMTKRRKQQRERCEMQRIKQLCKQQNYCDALEDYLPKKKKSFEKCCGSGMQSTDESTPKKTLSSEESAEKNQKTRQEEVPQKKSYSSEDTTFKKKYRYEEEFPPRMRFEEETAKRCCGMDHSRHYRYDEEPVPRRRRYEEETAPGRYDEAGYCIKKSPSNHKRYPKEKHYRKLLQEIQNISDKSFLSDIQKSQDSVIVCKRPDERRKMKIKKDKQSIETCKLKNIMKNLGRLKINIPFGGQFCDGKHEDHKKPGKLEKSEASEKGALAARLVVAEKGTTSNKGGDWNWEYGSYDEDDEDTSEDDYDCEYNEYKSRSPSLADARPTLRDDREGKSLQHSQHRKGMTDTRSNCRCVRVYLQSQAQQGWPGVAPFQKLSSISLTEVTTSKTPESCKSTKSNTVFPDGKEPVYQVACAWRRKRRANKKCKKHKHKRCKCKCKCKKAKLDENHCRCKKCGNIHIKGCSERMQEPRPLPKPQIKLDDRCRRDSSPMFSFLSNFCKPRTRETTGSRVLQKLNEVRYLKTCRNMGRKKPLKPAKGDDKCACKPRLTDIEYRLSELESCKCKKKKKKKKKKRKCNCQKNCCRSSTVIEPNLEECNRKKEREYPTDVCYSQTETEYNASTHSNLCGPVEQRESECACGKKKKKKKRKCKCQCSEIVEKPVEKPRDPGCETAAYYQTIYYPSPVKTENISTSSTTKSTTMDEKESEMCTKEQPQKNQRAKESSLHSFWKYLCKYKLTNGRNGVESFMKKIRRKKSACVLEPNITLIEGSSKGSPMPMFRPVEMDEGDCGKNSVKKEKEHRRSEKHSTQHRKRHS